MSRVKGAWAGDKESKKPKTVLLKSQQPNLTSFDPPVSSFSPVTFHSSASSTSSSQPGPSTPASQPSLAPIFARPRVKSPSASAALPASATSTCSSSFSTASASASLTSATSTTSTPLAPMFLSPSLSSSTRHREERVSELVGFRVSAAQNVIFSGAADGADLFFGRTATAANYQVIHWSFAGHCKGRPEGHGYYAELTDAQLVEADPPLRVAAKGLGKSSPQKIWVKRLLQRNFFQVRWVDAVYAVTWHDKDNSKSMLKVGGGTGWACQLYIDRFLRGERGDASQECRLFFFDVNTSVWRKWNLKAKDWDILPEGPPPPSGWSAGIGTSELIGPGAVAIRNLFTSSTEQKC